MILSIILPLSFVTHPLMSELILLILILILFIKITNK